MLVALLFQRLFVQQKYLQVVNHSNEVTEPKLKIRIHRLVLGRC